MRFLMFAAVLTMFGTTAAAQPAQSAPQPTGAQAQVPSLARIAEQMRTALPQQIRPGTTLVGVAADGNVLVLTIEAPREEVIGVEDGYIATEFARGFCAGGGEAFFGAGHRLRVDPQVAGSTPRRGIVVERCPG